MKKRTNYLLLIISLFILFISNANAEQKSIVIEGSGDEYANYTALADDGSFVVVGEFDSTDIKGLTNNGDYDGYIVKYDKTGKQLWIKNYGGSDYERFTSVVNTSDGGYIVVGEVCSTDITGITLVGDCDALAVKYDTNGNVVWQKNYGGTYEDYFNVIEKANNTYLLGGYVDGITIDGTTLRYGGYLLEINEAGTKEKEQIVGSDEIFTIAPVSSGGYVFGTYTQYNYLYYINSNLEEVWSINAGKSYIYINDILVTEDDEILVVGSGYLTNSSDRSAYLAKVDIEGNVKWVKTYGTDKEAFNAINLDENGNYIITGGKKSTIWNESVSTALMIKYDTEGNVLSENIYQGDDATWFYGMDYVSENGYVFVGSSYENGTVYQDDIFIVFDTQDFMYEITTKVNGKGTITTSQNEATANTEITFTVTPEDGYVLGEVKVTDADGNTIEFTDYTFTMPSANVTIEVTFLPENPDTKDIAIIGIAIISIIGVASVIKHKRKTDWINQ